ncbi:MAG: hypothetical protein R3C28_33320, partial [Pirellulaceae bacterium]
EIQPDKWRLVRLQMAKSDGSQLDLQLLRPMEWVDALQASPRRTVHLNLAEMGAVGDATVLSVEACPAIAVKPSERHRVVTGKFVHSSADVIDGRDGWI